MKAISILLAVLIMSVPIFCLAADGVADKPDFSKLRNQRSQVIAEVDAIKTDVRKNDDAIRDLPVVSSRIENHLKEAKRGLEDVRAKLETEKNGNLRINRISSALNKS